MSRTLLRAEPILLGLLALAACAPESRTGDEDVSGQELAATAIDNIERALRGTHRAGAFLANSQAVADVLSALGSGSTECDYPPCLPDGTCPDPVCEAGVVTLADLREAHGELDEGISDLILQLQDDIFNEENLESEDDESATFLLRPESLCSLEPGETPSAPGEPAPAPELDSDCVDALNRLQPRLRLTSAGDHDVNAELLLTSAQHRPAIFQFHRDHLLVGLDLGELQATLAETNEEIEGLVSIDGLVAFQLRRNAELDYSFNFNVMEEVVVFTDQDGAALRLSLGTGVPTSEFRLDGNAREFTGRTDLGRLTASGPLNAFRDFFDSQEYDDLGNPLPEKNYTGELEIVVPGLEASATYASATDRIGYSGVGLGDASSTLKWNGITLAQVDLNAELGRHFDVAVETPAMGAALLTLSPGFDLSVLLNFLPLADQIDQIAPWLLDDTLHVWFDGSPSVQLDDDAFRVVSGTLNMTSAAVPDANVSVPAGMCLVERETEVSSHELLGELGAGVCPAP